MVQLDFSICLRGSSPVVRNFTGVGFDVLARYLIRGEEWDGVTQPGYLTEKTQPWDHKTYNGYISSVFMPITKAGKNLRPQPSNPQPGYRNSANSVSRSLIMLDFDALPVGSMDQVLAELDAENVLGAVYTTYNHLNEQKGGLERFRAIVVTDRPMMVAELAKASYAFFDLLRERLPFLEADNASFNPAFAMYRPPANSFIRLFEAGDPYPVDSLLQDYDELQLQLPVKALTAGNWEPATPEDMALCEDWLDWADANALTVTDGQIWVCCPEQARHSSGSLGDGTDGGASIFLPSAKKGQATFVCLHSHCQEDVNRHQRDSMLAISEHVKTPIPVHLLPDPHGGHAKEDRAKMRRMLAEMAEHNPVADEAEEMAGNGLRKRIRKEGAIDKKDLPARIGGTFMLDISGSSVTRLAEMSQRYIFVVQGGQSRYYHRSVNAKTGKASWCEWQLQTMRDVLANEEGVVGSYPSGDSLKYKTLSLFDAMHHWLGRNHKTGGAAIFPPPVVCPPDMLNTWEGFAVDPAPGDVAPFEDYVLRVLCSGDDKLARYFTQWLAHTVQHPGNKPGVAIVMRSGQGNGKGQLAKLLDRIMGDLFMPYNGTTKLTGQFNISLMTTLLAFIDEAKARGAENDTIKGLVTESRAIFEGKGSNSIKGQSFTRLIFASNEIALKIDKGDRRYCVLTLDPRFAANDENKERDTFARPYWRDYSDWVNQAWVPAAVLDYLRNFDLSDFDEYNAPKTHAHAELVSESLTWLQEWMLWQATENKFKLGTLATRPDQLVLMPNIVVEAYTEYAEKRGIRDTRSPMSIKKEFGMLMKRMGVGRTDFKGQTSAENRYGYVFASQDDLYLDLCSALGVNPEYD